MYKKIVDLMVNKNVITEEDRELYTYGVQMLFEQIIGLLAVAIICIVFKKFLEGLVFLIAFTLLRKFAGGYHANHFISCFLISSGVFLALMLVTNSNICSNIILCLNVITAPVVFIASPVEVEAKPLNNNEKKVYRFKARVILLAEIFIIAVLLLLNFKMYAVFISCANIITCILLVIQLAVTYFKNK